MNTTNNQSPDTEEFEDLLTLKMMDELSQTEATRLEELVQGSPELKERYDSILLAGDFFDYFPEAELEKLDALLEPELGQKSGPVVANQEFGMRKGLYGLIGAAAALALALTGYLYLGNTGPAGPYASLSMGQCESGNSSLKSGDAIRANGARSGKESVCDLRFPGPSGASLRLFPDTKITYRNTKKSLLVNLHSGHILFTAAKVPGRRELKIRSGGREVQVQGTSLALRKSAGGKLRVELVQGLARVRSANYLALSALPLNFSSAQKAALAAKLPELFREQSLELGPGNFVTVANRKVDPALLSSLNALVVAQKSAGLDANALLRADSPLWSKMQTALKQTAPEARNTLTAPLPTHQKGTLGRSELWQLKRSFSLFHKGPHQTPGREKDAPSPEVKRKLRADVIAAARQDQAPSRLYKITLTDGRSFIGVLESKGKRLLLQTSQGNREIKRSQLKKLVPLP